MSLNQLSPGASEAWEKVDPSPLFEAVYIKEEPKDETEDEEISIKEEPFLYGNEACSTEHLSPPPTLSPCKPFKLEALPPASDEDEWSDVPGDDSFGSNKAYVPDGSPSSSSCDSDCEVEQRLPSKNVHDPSTTPETDKQRRNRLRNERRHQEMREEGREIKEHIRGDIAPVTLPTHDRRGKPFSQTASAVASRRKRLIRQLKYEKSTPNDRPQKKRKIDENQLEDPEMTKEEKGIIIEGVDIFKNISYREQLYGVLDDGPPRFGKPFLSHSLEEDLLNLLPNPSGLLYEIELYMVKAQARKIINDAFTARDSKQKRTKSGTSSKEPSQEQSKEPSQEPSQDSSLPGKEDGDEEMSEDANPMDGGNPLADASHGSRTSPTHRYPRQPLREALQYVVQELSRRRPRRFQRHWPELERTLQDTGIVAASDWLDCLRVCADVKLVAERAADEKLKEDKDAWFVTNGREVATVAAMLRYVQPTRIEVNMRSDDLDLTRWKKLVGRRVGEVLLVLSEDKDDEYKARDDLLQPLKESKQVANENNLVS